jgi:hypothetical protein
MVKTNQTQSMRSYAYGKQTVIGVSKGDKILKKHGLYETKIAGLKNLAKKKYPGGSKTRVRKRWIAEQAKKLVAEQKAEGNLMSDAPSAAPSESKETKTKSKEAKTKSKEKKTKSKETKTKSARSSSRSKSKDTKMKD